MKQVPSIRSALSCPDKVERVLHGACSTFNVSDFNGGVR